MSAPTSRVSFKSPRAFCARGAGMAGILAHPARAPGIRAKPSPRNWCSRTSMRSRKSAAVAFDWMAKEANRAVEKARLDVQFFGKTLIPAGGWRS